VRYRLRRELALGKLVIQKNLKGGIVSLSDENGERWTANEYVEINFYRGGVLVEIEETKEDSGTDF
jgi:hypothetical protein